MKSNSFKTMTRAIVAVFFAVLIGGTAQAGSGIHESYVPMKIREAEAIKPGDRLAISCGNCGVTTVFTVGTDRSFLRGYTCDTCKKKFVARPNPHGGSTGNFVYEDDAGHLSHLLRAK